MDDGAESVLRSMRARRPRLGVTARKDLDAARSYIATQHQLGRMKYAEAREKNYPIGTGITEAAAKTVVGTRMKRAGARFSQHGGQTIMLFRTTLLSERFQALHEELAATYRATVKTRRDPVGGGYAPSKTSLRYPDVLRGVANHPVVWVTWDEAMS